MKDKAIAYLMKDILLNVGMIEPIRRNTATILYADTDGVLLKEQKSDAYMISVDNFERGIDLVDKISECSLIVAHQEFMVDYILNKFGLHEKLKCVQAVYMDKAKIDVTEELEIRQLEPKYLKVILEHYDKLCDEEIKEILVNGN